MRTKPAHRATERRHSCRRGSEPPPTRMSALPQMGNLCYVLLLVLLCCALDASAMQIFVETPSDETITLDVEQNDTIDQVTTEAAGWNTWRP